MKILSPITWHQVIVPILKSNRIIFQDFNSKSAYKVLDYLSEMNGHKVMQVTTTPLQLIITSVDE